MEIITVTKQQARRFLLAYQGLCPSSGLKGKSGILDHIRRVGCIQYDPLNIVGHNPELVLQSRIPDFRPAMLRELLYKDRSLLDGWDKMMAIYRTEDWPYFRRMRESARDRLGSNPRPVAAILPQVRKSIEELGPLSSIDLDYDQAVDWPWAPTRLSRAVLESMYFWGELVIHHRINTRKVYDFASRHIPGELLSAPEPNRTQEQYHDWYVLRRIGGIGLLWGRSGDAWIGIDGLKSAERRAALARLQERGEVAEVRVEGMQVPLYMRSTDKPLLDSTSGCRSFVPRTAILAPLDNMLWDRQLLKELFDFEYRWEVYKPAGERRYGYYVLPVLYGDRFIARFEPGHDKKSGALIIRKWWWEPGIRQTKKMHQDLILCFRQFLGYLGADHLLIDSGTAEQAGLELIQKELYKDY